MKKSLSFMLVMVLAMGWMTAASAQTEDKTPEEILEEKLEAIDITDPDQLFEVADWARKVKKSGKVRSEGKRLLKEVLDLDEDHADARKALGFVQHDGKWYRKRALEKELKKQRSADMKSKGYIHYKSGWIKKEDRRQWNNKWEKNDDDVWMSFEDVQRAKGLVLYKGVWLRLNDDDRKAMEHHRKMTGDDILVTSTEHFQFYLMVPPKFAERYTKLIEEIYGWFVSTMETPAPQDKMLFGQRAHVWTFENTQQYQDWITTYSDHYEFTEENKKYFREKPGGRILPNKRIITCVAKQAEDLEHQLVHTSAQLMISWHALGRITPSLSESFAHLTESLYTQEKNGVVSCTTRSRYGGDGGVAGKDFNTRDGIPRAKSIVKADVHIPFRDLSMLGLNSLNGDHLAQGYSLIEWLFNHHRGRLVKLFMGLRDYRIPPDKAESEELGAMMIAHAVRSAFGDMNENFDLKDLETLWVKYVKKAYR